MSDPKPGEIVTVYRSSRHRWRGATPDGRIESFRGNLSATGKTVTKQDGLRKSVARLSDGWSLDLCAVLAEELVDLNREADRLRQRLETVKGRAGNIRGRLWKMDREAADAPGGDQ